MIKDTVKLTTDIVMYWLEAPGGLLQFSPCPAPSQSVSLTI
jgi:hypothetical protein